MRRPHRSGDGSGSDRPLCAEDLRVHASGRNPERSETFAQRVHERALAVTDCDSPHQIHGFALMPAVIPAANHVMMEIAGLMPIQLDPA
jgi:hypothetical protein